MKNIFCSIVLLGNILSGSANPWQLPINALKLEVTDVSRTGKITIKICNNSKQQMRLWKESNSWGAARWRVLLIRKNRLETLFQYHDSIFTVNLLSFNEIAAGASIEKKLDLNGGSWCGLGTCTRYFERGFGDKEMSFEPGDIVIVIYDVPPTTESYEYGVWAGTAAAVMTVP